MLFLQRRQWHPTPVLLPGKSHGRRSLVGCRPWGLEESDTTEQLHFHFSLSCIGEGNGNPPQYSCLENPRDGGAWWAAIYGVAQSRTRQKRLSSSSSSEQPNAYIHAVHSYNGILFGHKKEILPFVTKRIDLEGSKLSEISQKGKEKYCIICCCCQVASVVSDSVRPHRWQPIRLHRS